MLLQGKIKVAVAKVIKAHGIHGELSVELDDLAEPDEDFAPGACLIAEIDGLDVPYFVKSARPRGAASYLLTLDDVGSDADAALLQGHVLYVYADPEDIEGNDGAFASDLVGYHIIDSASDSDIGSIDALTELTPGAWYFNVGSRLIPAVNEFIINVDRQRRAVIMALPGGILEL